MTTTDTVAQLRAAVDAVRADLAQFGEQPELMRDVDGRYILLPALAALAIAETGAHAALSIGPGQHLIVGLPATVTRQTLDEMSQQVDEQNLPFKVVFITCVEHLAVAETG